MKPTLENLQAALEVRFDCDAGDDISARDYLRRLLALVWEEGESFSGKRPWGNSGWEYDILIPLAKAKFIDLGRLNEEGEPYDWTGQQMRVACAFVADMIEAAFQPRNKP